MKITLEELLNKLPAKLGMEAVGVPDGKNYKIKYEYINVLGLELVGFPSKLKSGQVQLIDKKSMTFFKELGEKEQEKNLKKIFSNKIPCIIFTDAIKPDKKILRIAKDRQVPVFKTRTERWKFVREIHRVLTKIYAPSKNHRGTMMEVFGIGVLIIGKSNIGKSECALDLLYRGHCLVGDDVVKVTKRSGSVVLARGRYPIAHRMELRGVGIVDIIKLMGIGAVKEVQKVDIIVGLEKWRDDKSYERLGIEQKFRKIFDVEIPYIEIPVAPGRNTANMVEMAAMNYRLRKRGVIPGEELDELVRERMENEPL
ncbi:MAG: HPr(Ser) kinase/phosphatase [Elusimicrobiota bacterium]